MSFVIETTLQISSGTGGKGDLPSDGGAGRSFVCGLLLNPEFHCLLVGSGRRYITE